MSNIQPSQGRIVLFHINRSETKPAIIVDVNADSSVFLHVFTQEDIKLLDSVKETFTGDPNPTGKYSWPKRVGPGV